MEVFMKHTNSILNISDVLETLETIGNDFALNICSGAQFTNQKKIKEVKSDVKTMISQLRPLFEKLSRGDRSKEERTELFGTDFKKILKSAAENVGKHSQRSYIKDFKDLYDTPMVNNILTELVESFPEIQKEAPQKNHNTTIVDYILTNTVSVFYRNFMFEKYLDKVILYKTYLHIETMVNAFQSEFAHLAPIAGKQVTSEEFHIAFLARIKVLETSNRVKNALNHTVQKEVLDFFHKQCLSNEETYLENPTDLMVFKKDSKYSKTETKKAFIDERRACVFFFDFEKDAILEYMERNTLDKSMHDLCEFVNTAIHGGLKVLTLETLSEMMELMVEDNSIVFDSKWMVMPTKKAQVKTEVQLPIEVPLAVTVLAEVIDVTTPIAPEVVLVLDKEDVSTFVETTLVEEEIEETVPDQDTFVLEQSESSISEDTTIAEVIAPAIECTTDLDLPTAKTVSVGAISLAVQSANFLISKKTQSKSRNPEAERFYVEFLAQKAAFFPKFEEEMNRIGLIMHEVNDTFSAAVCELKKSAVLQKMWKCFEADCTVQEQSVQEVLRELITIPFERLRFLQEELPKLEEKVKANVKSKYAEKLETNRKEYENVINDLYDIHGKFMKFTNAMLEYKPISLEVKVAMEEKLRKAEEAFDVLSNRITVFPFSQMLSDEDLRQVDKYKEIMDSCTRLIEEIESIFSSTGKLQFLDKVLGSIYLNKKYLDKEQFMEVLVRIK